MPDPVSLTPIADALRAIPTDKRAALIVRADSNGEAYATLAARYGDHWKIAAGASYNYLNEKRPKGYVAIEASW